MHPEGRSFIYKLILTNLVLLSALLALSCRLRSEMVEGTENFFRALRGDVLQTLIFYRRTFNVCFMIAYIDEGKILRKRNKNALLPVQNLQLEYLKH